MKNRSIKLKNIVKEDENMKTNLNHMSLIDIDKIVGRMIQKSENLNRFSESDYSKESNKKLNVNRLRLSSWEKLKKHPYSRLSMTDLAGYTITDPKEVEKYLKELYNWFNSNRKYYTDNSSIEDLDKEIENELISSKNSKEFADSINKYVSKYHDKYWYVWLAMISMYIGRAILELSTP
jgi:hypothetical protein